MPYYGAKQAAALYAKYSKKKAHRIIEQLKSDSGKKKKARKKKS